VDQRSVYYREIVHLVRRLELHHAAHLDVSDARRRGVCRNVLGLRKQGLRAPLTFTIAFTIAIIGGAAAYYAVHNVAGIPGWYLWPAGGAMAILIVAGLRPYSILFAALLALTDLYGAAARMMPYYAGLAARYHGSVTQFTLAATRLHTPMWLAVAWIGSTIALPLLMLQRGAKTRM